MKSKASKPMKPTKRYAIFAVNRNDPGRVLGYSEDHSWWDDLVQVYEFPRSRSRSKKQKLLKGYENWNKVKRIADDAIYKLNLANHDGFDLVICRIGSRHCPANILPKDYDEDDDDSNVFDFKPKII